MIYLKLPFDAKIDSEYDIDEIVIWPSYSQADPAIFLEFLIYMTKR